MFCRCKVFTFYDSENKSKPSNSHNKVKIVKNYVFKIYKLIIILFY